MPSNLLPFDPARPETWPALLRESAICSDTKRGWPGLLPLSRQTWRRLVVAGAVSQGVLLGTRIRAWPAAEIRELVEHGIAKHRDKGRHAKCRAVAPRAAREATESR